MCFVMCIPGIDSVLIKSQAQQTLQGLTACYHTQAMDFVFTVTIVGVSNPVIFVIGVVVVAAVTNSIITGIITTVKATDPVLKPRRSVYGLAGFAMNIIFCHPRAWSLRSSV